MPSAETHRTQTRPQEARIQLWEEGKVGPLPLWRRQIGIVKLFGQLWWAWIIGLRNMVQYCMLPAVLYEMDTDPSWIDTNKRFYCRCNYPSYVAIHLIYSQLSSYRGEKTKLTREICGHKGRISTVRLIPPRSSRPTQDQPGEADPTHIIRTKEGLDQQGWAREFSGFSRKHN